MTLFKLFCLQAFIVFSAFATNVAIIDSGTDVHHTFLKPYIWINPIDNVNDGVDHDGNGYINDIYGWNFAEKNNLVLDETLLGTFSPDVYRFFDIQARYYSGHVTPEEIAWMKSKKDDQAFYEELGTFGNFAHGTHVSGIAVKESANNFIMAVKIIPTKTSEILDENDSAELAQIISRAQGRGFIGDALVAIILKYISIRQGKSLGEVGTYVNGHKMQVANGSFGIGFEQAASIVMSIFKGILNEEPTEEKLIQFSFFLMDSIIKESTQFVTNAPNTLFVFAAGNEKLNNDELPTSPANIKEPNTISVAATIGQDHLAPFSNYGAAMVEVAAPGVAIHSSVPGDLYIKMSGTSQAAPFVANVAGRVFDINPLLKPKEVKTIIMETVDHKNFLEGKVVSAGIVNPLRAMEAAKLSRSMNLKAAITNSVKNITDISSGRKHFRLDLLEDIWVLPLPSSIQL